MVNKDKALKQALEALEKERPYLGPMPSLTSKAITAIKEALAQPEQEPVVWWNGDSKVATPKAKDWDKRTGGTTAFGCDIPLYTTPPKREWVGLTDEEIYDAYNEPRSDAEMLAFGREIEAKLKKKNI